VQSGGDIVSHVPVANYFDIVGTGGFPGIPYYGGSTNLTGASVSPTGWLVNTSASGSKVYNYDYFANLIPEDITVGMNPVDTADVAGSLTSGSATHDTNNYYWYKYDGLLNSGQPLTIPAVDFGTRKVVLMVDNADVNITGNINLTAGQGFFLVIVKGNINVDPAVGGGSYNLVGLYFTDGAYSDGIGNKQLWVRGSVVANNGINLERDLGASNPSELFAYAPDQILLFPKVLGTRRINWKEVAP
jgi:hypothetical protein